MTDHSRRSQEGFVSSRVFSHEKQLLFARLSGDYNPLHLDPVASRRLIFGRQIVHGVNVLVTGLSELAVNLTKTHKIINLECLFKKPIYVEQPVSFEIKSRDKFKYEINIAQNEVLKAQVHVELIEDIQSNSSNDLSGSYRAGDGFEPEPPDTVDITEISKLSGVLEIPTSQPAAFMALYGAKILACYDLFQIRELVSLSRLVGMKVPGMNSVFSRIKAYYMTSSFASVEGMEYKVAAFDPRFGLTTISFSGRQLCGEVTALVRPEPVQQPKVEQLADRVKYNEFSTQRAVIIGGSRGLGALVAKYLAVGGATLFITSRAMTDEVETITRELHSINAVFRYMSLDVLCPSDDQLAAICNFRPTHLYYFATPHIFSPQRGGFNWDSYDNFNSIYIKGLHRILRELEQQPLKVFAPSTIFINELNIEYGEYIVSKVSMEYYFRWLCHAKPQFKFYMPRLPKIQTDQTTSFLRNEFTDNEFILKSIRDFLAS